MSLTFLTPWILAGAAAVAVPIIIHLILRKQPKHLIFPAFRFLLVRHRTNLQKLRLRHLLLLALRVLLLFVIALALARPLLTAGVGELGGDSPIAVLIILDTSPSMEYEHEGKTRLAHSQEQAQQVLEQLPASSQAAILDTGEPGAQFVPVRDAVKLVQNRRIRAANRPVTACVDEAFRLLEKEAPDMPLLLCVLSDRTAASWNSDTVAAYLRPAKARLEEKLRRPVKCVYFDLSVKEPRNVAITNLALKQDASATGTPLESLLYGSAPQRFQIQATVQVTGTTVNQELLLFMDGQSVDSKRVDGKAQPGQAANVVVTFEPIALPAEPTTQIHQGEVRLKNGDLLDADNVRYWSLVRSQRKVLVISDSDDAGRDWRLALESIRILAITAEVKKPDQVPAVLHPDQYQAVYLFNVAHPGPELWQALQRYVAAGGGLVVIPGDNLNPDAYASEPALALLPGRYMKPNTVAAGTYIAPTDYDHPIMQFFKTWERRRIPGTIYQFWEVKPQENLAKVVAPYAYQSAPAIIERFFDPQQKVQGRVVMLTTPMYQSPRERDEGRTWNTFNIGYMSIAIPYVTVRHVIGAREERQNFQLGEDIRFWLPRGPGFSAYQVTGPESGIGEVKDGDTQLAIQEARRGGNYRVADQGGKVWQRHFSVNVPATETQLLTQISPSEIDALFGENSFHLAQKTPNLQELVKEQLGQTATKELLPYLMVLLLILLAAENFLANRFYRKDPELT